VWEPEGVPTTTDRFQHEGAALTRDGAGDDVVRAREAVHNARVTYGRHEARPTTTQRWRRFVGRYGWRAYALPVLVVVTVAALFTTTTGKVGKASDDAGPVHKPAVQQAPPTAAPSITLKNDNASQSKINNVALRAAALPPGAPYTKAGTGTFRMLKGTSPKVGTGRLFRYSIEVENGITGIDLTQFEHLVVSTLADSRSWSGHGVALERVDSGPIDFHVSLVSVMTVRKLCGYSIPVETSCYVPAGPNSNVNRVVFNDARWVRGATAYVGDLSAYRIYMINHEDGHALGHQHAHQCLPGGLAPVMMQQTFGLRSAATNKLCEANPWPYPPGAKGAPGAEQPDTPANDEYGLGDE
jgi:hypothetical protein